MLLHFVIRALEAMFFTGLAGSFIVAIIAFVGDFEVLLNRDNAGSQTPILEANPGSTEAFDTQSSQPHHLLS